MEIQTKPLEDIRLHAAAEAVRHRECCGLVVIRHGKQVYYACRNTAASDNEFVIAPEDWVAAEDAGHIVMVVHSHIGVPAVPSQADLVGIENTQLPWLIINMPTGEYTVTNPTGYVADLIGRQFSHGVLDCYSLIRDYYRQTLGITLKDYVRDHEWWRKDKNLYRDNFSDAGFHEVRLEELREHDVILMRLGSNKDNHILHHPMTRLSSRDVYGKGSYWHKITSCALRHEAYL
jgi:proteasome lid subunit RPN8/RPN11